MSTVIFQTNDSKHNNAKRKVGTAADVSKTFKRVNPRKTAGPDGIPSRVLRACADQLAGVFTDIFNQSLPQSAVPTCFKWATIVPVPKKAKGTNLNDYRTIALTSVIIKSNQSKSNLFI